MAGYAFRDKKYPMGGFYQLVLAIQKVAEEQGVIFHFNQNVQSINVENLDIKSLR